MIPSPSVEILTWLEEPGRNSQNVNKVVVEPHQWNFLEICPLEFAGNLPEVTGNVVHGEVSHQKHSDILLPQGGLKEAAGYGVVLATLPCTSRALEKPREVQRLALEKPGVQRKPVVPAIQDQEAKL